MNTVLWAIFTTLCFISNLQIGPISKSACPWLQILMPMACQEFIVDRKRRGRRERRKGTEFLVIRVRIKNRVKNKNKNPINWFSGNQSTWRKPL